MNGLANAIISEGMSIPRISMVVALNLEFQRRSVWTFADEFALPTELVDAIFTADV